MKILSFKPGHDGSIAGIDADAKELLFSYEAEKDSFPRNSAVHPNTFIDAAKWFKELPDVLALSGWSSTTEDRVPHSVAGYSGLANGSEIIGKQTFFGKYLEYYSSTHERSHIWCAYALSPYEQGEPCYVLVWEGELGNFYEIDGNLKIHKIGQVMPKPGSRYSFLYTLADRDRSQSNGGFRKEDPGRLMALSAFGDVTHTDPEAQELVDTLLNQDESAFPLKKSDFVSSPFHDIGIDTQRFKDLAAKYSDSIFTAFYEFAKANMNKGYPLLISGGCGLNCNWNTRWRESGLFRDVFVPPCTSDSGSSIGTAVDAMRHFCGSAKLDWTVYSGQPFVDDQIVMDDMIVSELNLKEVASALYEGKVIGWAAGCCEIGPRALGNRSIFASPLKAQTRERLNRVKGRDGTAPVAPVCLEEDVSKHFDWAGPSPHMLYFQNVTDASLEAIRHVDGSARVQTINRDQHPILYDLLTEFKAISGVGVLCNTSLNFKKAGFINRTSDLYHYACSLGLDGFVAGISHYRFR